MSWGAGWCEMHDEWRKAKMYRLRAEEIRTLAWESKPLEPILMKIAADYEATARHLEASTDSKVVQSDAARNAP